MRSSQTYVQNKSHNDATSTWSNIAAEMQYANENHFSTSCPGQNPSPWEYIPFQNSGSWEQVSETFMKEPSFLPQQMYWNSGLDTSFVTALPIDKSTAASTGVTQIKPAKSEDIQRTIRRREQNREDQRRYRARKENALRKVTVELEKSRERLEEAKQHNSLLVQQWKVLEARIAQLEDENRALKAMSPAQSSYSWDDSAEEMSRVGSSEQWYQAGGSSHSFR